MKNDELLHLAKEYVDRGDSARALLLLSNEVTPDADFGFLARLAKWTSSMRWSALVPVKAAFLGGGTLEHLVQFVRMWLAFAGIDLVPYLPLYGAWQMEIANPESGLYAFEPDIVWFFTTRRDIRLEENGRLSSLEAEEEVAKAVDECVSRWRHLSRRLPKAQIIQNNSDFEAQDVFGNLSATLPGSLASLRRAFNSALALDSVDAGVHVFDLDRVACGIGLRQWSDDTYWHYSKHPFPPSLSGQVAFSASRLLRALRGGSKKAVILDLDGVLWGGTIGDDGIDNIKLGDGPEGEAFTAFQSYLKGLSDRGVILAVASKNDMENARQPFLEHPGMRLSLDDIVVFKASWYNKADAIREIAAELNLGLDSFVFLDDTAAERELVKAELPMVSAPEMPKNVAEYAAFLDHLSFFEMPSFSLEDRARGRMYQENTRRNRARAAVTDIDAFLKSLDMKADSGAVDSFHLPRMAQLINKSNQFHPTTTRYTEAELLALSESEECVVRWFSLKDRFGDYGLISVAVLRRDGDAFIIDTWAMSCRVLERGLERYIMPRLADLAAAKGGDRLCGAYVPTAKNGLVADLYPKLGFKRKSGDESKTWWEATLPLTMPDNRSVYIATVNDEPL